MGEGRSDKRQDRMTTALILIAIGVMLLIGQLTDQWPWVLLLLGLGFLGLYFRTRNYGWLVPGGIVTGLGVGLVGASTFGSLSDEATAPLILIPFGLGFILIWVLDTVFTRASTWWPLIPGAIIAGIGLAVGIGGVALDILEVVGTWWPLVLILIGGWILFSLRREGGADAGQSEDG